MSSNINSSRPSSTPTEKSISPLRSSSTQQASTGQPSSPRQQTNNAWRRQSSASINQPLSLEDDHNDQTTANMSSINSSGCSSSIMSDGDKSKSSDTRKSSISRAVDKAKAKLSRSPSGAEMLADNDEQFEKMKAKEMKKEQRKEEYERLELGKQTKYGMGGSGMGAVRMN